MKMNKKFTALLAGLTAVAVIMIVISGVGVSRAVANYNSSEYHAELAMQHVGVAIVENDAVVAVDGEQGILLSNLIPEDEKLALNKAYDEVIAVSNTGNIDEYVRVVLDLYWLDPDGNKCTELAPQMIDLNILEDSGWIVDPSSSYLEDGEQLILYYSSSIAPGTSSAPLSDTIKIKGEVAKDVKEIRDGSTITYIYKYNGFIFAISAEADAIQTHNGSDAALSVWGVALNAEDGNLSLN